MLAIEIATRLLVGITLTTLVSSCGGSSSAVAPSPAPPTPVAPRVPSPQTGPFLTGVVFQNTGPGRRALPGVHVNIVDLLDGPYGYFTSQQLITDADGRFSAGNLFPGRAVKVTAFGGPNGVLNTSGLSQVCAVHPLIDGDTTADIELVQDGAFSTTPGSPALSGVVFDTVTGRRPVAGALVSYSSRGHDLVDVYATTDASGRYQFCSLPLGPGDLVAGCSDATGPGVGSNFSSVSVEIRGDAVVDIDVTPTTSRCR